MKKEKISGIGGSELIGPTGITEGPGPTGPSLYEWFDLPTDTESIKGLITTTDEKFNFLMDTLEEAREYRKKKYGSPDVQISKKKSIKKKETCLHENCRLVGISEPGKWHDYKCVDCGEIFYIPENILQQEIYRASGEGLDKELFTFFRWFQWYGERYVDKSIEDMISIYMKERQVGDVIEKINKLKKDTHENSTNRTKELQ